MGIFLKNMLNRLFINKGLKHSKNAHIPYSTYFLVAKINQKCIFIGFAHASYFKITIFTLLRKSS